MGRRNAVRLVQQEAASQFATHVMAEAQTRSFRFKRQDGRSQYWFTLTWTPGHLALSGDLGELTLVHYHALRDFMPGVSWALSSDHDYLMSKTSVKQVYDADLTMRDLRHMLGEEAVGALNGYLTSRRIRSEDGSVTVERVRRPGFRQEMHAYRKAKSAAAIAFASAVAEWENSADGEQPAWEDFEPGRPEDPRAFERASTWRGACAAFGHHTSLDDLWHIPEGWHGWVRVWRKLRGRFYHPEQNEDPDFVLTARNRRLLVKQMQSELEEPSRAADFLPEIGMDDYYGTYVWSDHSYWQIAAIQHGVRMIIAAERAGAYQQATAHA